MHKPQIDRLVYSVLFPSSVQGRDPPTLQAHIAKNLVPEVRLETMCFYGPVDCLESQYPGLDYFSPGHRLRLSRFQWHRRLFRAFDALRLTEREIHQLCRWEGTKWARDRYEKDEGVKIRDTTWEGVAPCSERSRPTSFIPASRGTEDREDDDLSLRGGESIEDNDTEDGGGEYDEDEEIDESEDGGVTNSVGVELNQRLFAASEASARGEEVELNPAWEQWLKEAAERGTLPEMLSLINSGSAPEVSRDPTQWGQIIPEAFHYGADAAVPLHVVALQARMPRSPLHPSVAAAINADSVPSMPSASTAM
ncbi:hypothetical protein MMC13_008205 [Lambiella insularis]|nr:hypothetical protein [Lambiella insularis]